MGLQRVYQEGRAHPILVPLYHDPPVILHAIDCNDGITYSTSPTPLLLCHDSSHNDLFLSLSVPPLTTTAYSATCCCGIRFPYYRYYTHQDHHHHHQQQQQQQSAQGVIEVVPLGYTVSVSGE